MEAVLDDDPGRPGASQDHKDGGFDSCSRSFAVTGCCLGPPLIGGDDGGCPDELAPTSTEPRTWCGCCCRFCCSGGSMQDPGQVAPYKDTSVSLWPGKACPLPANRARPIASTLPLLLFLPPLPHEGLQRDWVKL